MGSLITILLLSSYKHRNYTQRIQLLTDSQMQWKMVVIQEANIAKNIYFKFIVFDPRSSSSHPLLLHDVLIYVIQKSTCTNVQCIWQIFLYQEFCYFRRVLTVTDFEWTVSISGDYFQFLFRILCFLKEALVVIPSSKGIN